MSDTLRPIRRALLSVYDKTGLVELARDLAAAGVELVSTGGSARALRDAGLAVTLVEELTGFPEALDDRVKTLHPAVHAGLLADMTNPAHVEELAGLGIAPFDLLVSNLYPFTDTVASGADIPGVIAQIDIGGPAMVRAAAKNHASLAVITSPASYDVVRQALAAGGTTAELRTRLAAQAFAHTASYDVAVASWLGNVACDTSDGTGFPAWMGATWTRKAVLRYGENPHQPAALYESGWVPTPGLAQAQQLAGKEMSYNNYLDAEAALRAAYDHGDVPTCAIVKHNNPCGVAVGADVAEAHRKAHATDPLSAFGGVIAVNRPVTREMAQGLEGIFTEVLVAPAYDDEALETLRAHKNLRILVVPAPARHGVELRPVGGGVLLQHRDTVDAVIEPTPRDKPTAGHGDDPSRWTLVAGPAVDDATLADLQFAWRSVRAVKSNAILLARDGAAVGIGMGQVNRVDSARLAVTRAGAERAAGSVAASDAFFPFADGLQILLDAGVRAVVAPGGSVRDAESIAAAQAAGVPLYFTGTRHFAH